MDHDDDLSEEDENFRRNYRRIDLARIVWMVSCAVLVVVLLMIFGD